MDTNLVLLWMVGLSCVSNARPAIAAARAGRRSWLVILLLIACATGLCAWLWFARAGVVGAVLFLVLVLVPGLLQRRVTALMRVQQYVAAGRYARVLAVLHPSPDFRHQPAFLAAMAAAKRGDFALAERALHALLAEPDHALKTQVEIQQSAIDGDWTRYLARTAALPVTVSAYDHGAHVGRLRALGEVGELAALVEGYTRLSPTLQAPMYAGSRVLAQLFAAAFTGRQDTLERLLRRNNSQLDTPAADFWRATCAYAAGDPSRARALLEALDGHDNQQLVRGARRRLAAPPRTAEDVLSDDHRAQLRALDREVAHDTEFASGTPLRSARLIQGLVALNAAAFVAELVYGGSEDGETLYRLGALVSGALTLDEGYRAFAALFLHYGATHLIMNVLALVLLGPYVEVSLGRLRTLLVYLASGLTGSLIIGLRPTDQPGLFLGASGCIMGLLGATTAILLWGYRRERARPARSRLWRIAFTLALQLAFDLSVPNVSLLAHWTGVLVGFALGALLLSAGKRAPDRRDSRDA